MKDYRKKEKLMYKILAKVYDLMDVICFPKKSSNPRLALAKKLSNKDLNILDVCCGTANTSIAIAQKNATHKIIGIDMSPDMLTVARNKISRKNLSNIELMQMDATNIKIFKQFDVVTTSLSLHEMPKDVMNTVISEMNRLLTDNGRIYIIEWSKPEKLPGRIMFKLFPYLFEPKGFGDFLKIDWDRYLNDYGLTVESIKIYSNTKLLSIKKSLN